MIGKQIEQNTRNGGSPVWCVTGLLWEGLVRLGLVMWRFCGAFLRHFGCLGAPFGVILAVLERFWASFWVSWALLARPFGPSWPKLAQDSEKNRFFEFKFRIWAPTWHPSWDPSWPKTLQNRGRSMKKAMLKNNTCSTSILKGFRPRFGKVFDRFFGSKTQENCNNTNLTKTVKIVGFP